MIVLKHLAQIYELSPYRLREKLRGRFGKHPRKRWKWASPEDPDYLEVIKFLDEVYMKGRKDGKKTKDKKDSGEPE